MKLQILIPQYKEDDDIIKPLLDSIEIQQNVDKNEIGVIIVNDGSDVHLSKTLLDKYSYRIDYYLHPHKGVSATRNACLDYATADYVMFCDADDMFYHICGLYAVFRGIDTGFDTLVSDFFEEIRSAGKTRYITHRKDCTFVHGKVYRRQYLVEQNIRWNEDLIIHEDFYFNTLCQRLTDSLLYISTPFYLWKWRDNSIVRSEPRWVINTYNHCIAGHDALVSELLRRGKNRDAQILATSAIFDMYFIAQKPEWINQKSQEHRKATENRIIDFYLKFKELYEAISPDEKNLIRRDSENKSRNAIFSSAAFERWLMQISGSDNKRS